MEKLNSVRMIKNAMGLEGDYELSPRQYSVQVGAKEWPEITSTQAVTIEADVKINAERGYIVLVVPHPTLYLLGVVSCQSHVEEGVPTVHLKPYSKSVDLTDLPYLCTLYLIK